MIYLTFGAGTVGVRTIHCSVPCIELSKLRHTMEIGDSFKDENSDPEVRLLFQNKEGLDVLLEALKACRVNLVESPPEMRMGA